MVSINDNRAAFRRYYEEGTSKGALHVFDEVLHPDVVPHTHFGGNPRGIQYFKGMVTLEREAFPDLTVSELRSVAEGDMVAAHVKISGTHEGEFLGLEPTGTSFEFQEIMIARFVDGRIVELWAVVDTLSLLQQLGVVPSELLKVDSSAPERVR